MKKNVKTILGLVMMITLCIVTGCGNVKNVEEEPDFMQEVISNDASDTDREEGEELVGEVKTINLYFRSYQTASPMNKSQIMEMKEELDKRTATELGVIVNFHWVENDKFDEVVKAKIDGGEDIDGIEINDIISLASNDLVQDINVELKKYAPNYYKQLDEFMPERIQSASFEDRLLFIPNRGIESYRYAVLARKELLEKYNVKNIENLEQYKEFLDKIKEGEEGILPSYTNAYSFMDLYTQSKGYLTIGGIYGEVKDKDLKLYTLDQLDTFDLAFQQIKDWSTNELLSVKQEGIMKLVSGECASAIVNIGLFNNLEGYLANLEDVEFEVLPLYLGQKQLRSNSSASGIAVTKNSKNSKSVIEFYEWIQNSQENYDLVMHGIKGKHYTLDDDKLKLIGTKYQNTVSGWYGSSAFKNYKLDRSSLLGKEEYVVLLERLNFENTKIFKDIAEEEIAPEKLVEENVDYAKYNELKLKIDELLMEVNEGYGEFISDISKGSFDKTINGYKENFNKEKNTELIQVITEFYLKFYEIV